MENSKKTNLDRQLMLAQQERIDSTIASLLFFLLTVIPLFTRTKLLEHYSPFITGSMIDSGTKGDVFTYYKFMLLLFGCGALVLFFLYKMTVGQYQLLPGYMNVPLAVFIVCIVCSALFADYKTLSVFGQYNRHDGAFTYLGYLTVFFVAANVIYSAQKLKSLLYPLYIVIGINAMFGLLYFYGYDVLKLGVIRGILFPSSLPPEAVNAGAHLDSTINNPNYVSGLAGMLVVLLLVKAALEKELQQKWLPLLFAVLAFAMLLGSLSTSGFFTFVVMIPVVCVVVALSPQRKQAFATIAVSLVLFGGVFGVMYSHNPQVWNESVGFFVGTSTPKVMGTEPMKELQTAAKKAVSPFAVEVAHAAGEPAPAVKNEFDLPQPAWGPGTGRVYIWTKTLELIEKRPLFGYGLDTLAYHFPQGDPEKAANLNDPGTIVDKPHNMYIGIAFGAGVIALLAFLALVVRHAWAHVKCLRKKIQTERQIMIASLFAGWLAYLIQALFNDSIIGPSIIFWMLFGIGVSLVRQETENVSE